MLFSQNYNNILAYSRSEGWERFTLDRTESQGILPVGAKNDGLDIVHLW